MNSIRLTISGLFVFLLGLPALAVAQTSADTAAGKASTIDDLEVRVRGYLHQDARFYAGGDHAGFNQFTLRRVRPIVEATAAGKYTMRIMPDFAGGNVVVQDAYIDLAFTPALQLRGGKFKAPVGLERLMSATGISFIERALPTSLVPNRDLGLQLHGVIGEGTLAYAVGVFNGAADGASLDGDGNDDKEVAARVFVQPFAATTGAFRGFGIGIAATHGEAHGTLTETGLAGYRSPGQNAFFSWRSSGDVAGTTVAAGTRTRVVPQVSWYKRQFGLIGEYARARHAVQLDTSAARLTAQAWQVTGSIVLTGEAASARGVRPRRAFDPQRGRWGAFELAARVHGFRMDDDAFPLFADPARAARGASAYGIGLNWYLHGNVKLVFNYDHTRFEGGAPDGGDRKTEHALFTRIQFAF